LLQRIEGVHCKHWDSEALAIAQDATAGSRVPGTIETGKITEDQQPDFSGKRFLMAEQSKIHKRNSMKILLDDES